MRLDRAHKPMILALAVLFGTGLAFGQAGRGVGRLGGVVLDLDGNPIPGAKVILEFGANANIRMEAETGAKGDWSLIGLGSGDWTLIVSAPGYDPVTQAVNVSQLQVNPKVTVRLQKAAKAGGGMIEDEASFEILERGNQCFSEGKYDDAIAAYEEFYAKNPKAYQVEISIADSLREKGAYDQAIAKYESALAKAEQDTALGKEMKAKALAGIGNTYMKQGQLEKAQEFLRQSVEASPDDEILAYNVGEIYFSNQQLDDAMKFFQVASEIKPDWPDPYLKLGYVHLNKGDNAAAAAAFEKFLTLEPEGERAALARNILGAIKK